MVEDKMKFGQACNHVFKSLFVMLAYMMSTQVIMLGLMAKSVPVCVAGLAISAYAIYKIFRKTLTKFGKTFSTFKAAGYAILTFAFIIAMQVILKLLFNGGTDQENQKVIVELFSFAPTLMYVTIAFLAPIVEEYCFREYLPMQLSKISGSGPKPWIYGYVPTIVSGALFTMMHSASDLFGILLYGSMAAILAVVRIKSNNLYVSMAAHVVWNTFGATLIILG